MTRPSARSSPAISGGWSSRLETGASRSSTDGGPSKRRGLGPFSGGQLTAIIITVVVMVGCPFAAFAVTGNNVFVTDATSGARARVDSGGHAVVGDGAGALTVDGTVSARDALPTKPITIVPKALQLGRTTTLYGPVNKPFAISSVTVTNDCGQAGGALLESATAPGGVFVLQLIDVPPGQTLHLTFPTPIVISPPAGGTATLQAYDDKDQCDYASGVGYQT